MGPLSVVAAIAVLGSVVAHQATAFLQVSRGRGIIHLGADTGKRSVAVKSLMMAAGGGNGGETEVPCTRVAAVQRVMTAAIGAGLAVSAVVTVAPLQAHARKPGVNKPELLPKEKTNVIDLAGMLTKGQAKRLNKQLEGLEKATGYKLRLLCQHYPDTPGLAVKDYWQVDDKTIVMVVDKGDEGSKAGGVNVLNFNVGDGFRLNLPAQFWQRLQNKYGNRFYVRDNGIDSAVISAVDSINLCLRSESGYCVDPPDLVKATRDQAVLASIGQQ